MIEKLKAVLKLVRWFHEVVAVLPFAALYFVVSYSAEKSGVRNCMPLSSFVIICICVQLLIAAGCILNDIMDKDIDSVNKPNTRIVERIIPVKHAILLFLMVSAMAFLLSIYITICIFSEWAVISISVYLLSVLYDVYFKRTPLFGNILVGILAAFIPLVIFFFGRDCIAALDPKLTVLVWLFSLFSFFIIVARELSLDISDMAGDAAVDCKTLPLLIGERKSKIIVNIILLTVIFASIYISCLFPYLIVPFGFTDVLLLYYLLLLRRCADRIDYIRAGRFLWFIMITGLIGFTLVSVF